LLKITEHRNTLGRKSNFITYEKNADFWDIKTEFVPHRRHITSPLQSEAG
jgi:hypothetical protein